MPNSQSDAVFSLVRSLSKGEKRFFKLYVSRNTDKKDIKFIRLFNSMDKMQSYDDQKLLKKNKDIKASQLPNLKAHLYNELLVALRLLHRDKNLDIQIREHVDHARILYNRGLVTQSLRSLDRAKTVAKNNSHYVLTLEILEFEKMIEGRHITRSIKGRANMLSGETDQMLNQIVEVSHLSNLSLLMYGYYLENGHIKNEKESKLINKYFHNKLTGIEFDQVSFFGKVHLHQAYCWYYFIQLDFARYFRHAKKWVSLFENHPTSKKDDPILYVKAIHNLMSAFFMTGRHKSLRQEIIKLQNFYEKETLQNTSLNAQTFVYLYIAKLNLHFLEGSFKKGLEIVPEIEMYISKFRPYIDQHRVMIFYYKIGCLFFGAGDNDRCIFYLNKIINLKVGHLRSDIQCFARILCLIAHYESDTGDILEYQIKSTYRFLSKMNDLDQVQRAILRFLRRSLSPKFRKAEEEFQRLHEELQLISKNKFARRSYQYLDISSWLESKMLGRNVDEVIAKKATLLTKQ